MTVAEAVIYLAVGCSAGLAATAGFFLQLVRVFYVDGQPVWRAVVYYPVSIFTSVLVGAAPIFLIVGFVMKEGWEDAGGWPRLIVFSAGVFLGLVGAVGGASLVFRKINQLQEKK
ncbi:MAG: hypothetical protein NT046_04520 [Arenimonas sp.]|nr:hypothetical protein [Arenimonas sp.]